MEARHRTAELPQAAVPVGELAQSALEVQIEFVNDARVEAHAGHENEVPAGLFGLSFRESDAERNANRHGVQKLARGVIGPVRESDFVGQNVRRPGGQNSERNVRSGDPVDDFVDGAVAARGENQIAAAFHGLRGQFAGALRAGRGEKFDLRARLLEDMNGLIQTRASRPFQSAGKRVVDESDTME